VHLLRVDVFEPAIGVLYGDAVEYVDVVDPWRVRVAGRDHPAALGDEQRQQREPGHRREVASPGRPPVTPETGH
jgi:hypothetical protein